MVSVITDVRNLSRTTKLWFFIGGGLSREMQMFEGRIPVYGIM